MSKIHFAFMVIHSCPLGIPGSRNTGGMNVYVRELATYLGRQGHKVDIYTRSHAGHGLKTATIARNVRLIHLADGNDNDNDKLAIYERLPVLVSNLKRFSGAKNLRYDILFSHYWISGAASITMQQEWQIPHITMFHTLGAVKNALPTAENEPAVRVLAETTIIKTVNRIIATTVVEKNLLSTAYNVNPKKITVIPCGVNTRLFRILEKAACRRQLNIPAEARCVLFAGRLEKIKGIERLLEAAALLKHIPHLKFIVLGGNTLDIPVLTALQSQTAAAGISDIVSFHPAVPQAEMPIWYNAADILALPSYAESFGLTALEAMACGTPVVANRVGAMPGLIVTGINGIMTPDNSPENIAGALKKVFDNYVNYSATAIRKSVASYTWSKIGRQIINECEQIVKITS